MGSHSMRYAKVVVERRPQALEFTARIITDIGSITLPVKNREAQIVATSAKAWLNRMGLLKKTSIEMKSGWL